MHTYFNVKNPKFGAFLRGSEVLEGLSSRKEKMDTTPPFLGQKNWGVILYEKN